MGSPNETRGLPFADQFIVPLFFLHHYTTEPGHRSDSLNPGARGLAGSIATPPPYLVISDKSEDAAVPHFALKPHIHLWLSAGKHNGPKLLYASYTKSKAGGSINPARRSSNE